MLLEGHLYFFTPFYFKDGGVPEDKFFLILKNIDGKSIIASLPTSVNKAPSLINIPHGCINENDRLFNCYIFQKQRIICENGFSFKLDTHIYGDKINDYDINIMTRDGTIKKGVDYNEVGKLKKVEFDAIIDCLIKSNSIIRRFRKLLSA